MKYALIITGILTGILGVYGMTIPLRVAASIGWVIGGLMLVNGIEATVAAFYKKKDIWQALLGVLIAVGGVVILFNAVQRILVDAFLTYMLGFMLLIYGAFGIYTGFKLMKISKAPGIASIIIGVFGVIVGLISVTHPLITFISVGYIISFNIFMHGMNMTVIGFSMGKEK